MIKKQVWCVLFAAAVTSGVSAGEWDFVPNVEMQYMGSVTEAQFEKAGELSEWGFRAISKLPKEVTAAMHEALESYDLDVGDWFTFSCGFEHGGRPKAIRVALRITKTNSNGTYSYSFYAWQMS